jgi:hypothetical protein
MECIICKNEANEVGSHIIPASLIKNCIGAHYREESFNIDSKNAKIDIYYGRDNLKNTSEEIKQNDYKRDNVLCKTCEKKLAELESKFASEFLAKFRVEKFNANFNIFNSENGYEIFEPKKISNIEIQAYFYSIILRYCTIYYIEDNFDYLKANDLEKIRFFVHGYLYDLKNYIDPISDFRTGFIFNKYSDKSLYIATFNQLQKPFTFYFCDAIVLLFTENLNEEETLYFGEYINTINQDYSRIVVGPETLYLGLSENMSKLMAEDFIANGVIEISQLNGKHYAENLMEVKSLLEMYTNNGRTGPIAQVFEDLRSKYGK